MRKVILHMLITMDGFITDRHGSEELSMPGAQWDEEVQQVYCDVFTNAEGVIFSRGIFQEYFTHWVKVANGKIKSSTDLELRWTQRLRDMQKYVVSNTLSTVTDKTSVLKGDITSQIRSLKKQQGGDLLLICGTSLYTLLTKEHFIDEYMLYVCPSVAGEGKHLFSQLSDTLELVFQKSVAFSSGMFLQYCKPIYRR